MNQFDALWMVERMKETNETNDEKIDAVRFAILQKEISIKQEQN